MLSSQTYASYGDETVSYGYDTSGNRTSLTSSVDGYTIASNSNQLNYRSKVPEDNDFTNMTYTYDAEGSLTQRGSGNNYDSFSRQSFVGMLTQIQKARGGSVQDTTFSVMNRSVHEGGLEFMELAQVVIFRGLSEPDDRL